MVVRQRRKQQRAIARQKRMIQFILQYEGEHGYSPSVRDIADHVGTSTSAIHYWLREWFPERGSHARQWAGLIRKAGLNSLLEAIEEA